MLSKIFIFTTFVGISINNIAAGPGDTARAKCKEYGKAVFSNEASPVLSRNPGSSSVSQCGIVEVPLIIGGVAAKPREFPHMAVIGFGQSPAGQLSWQCGGSLISENFVLTAAHCSASNDKGPAQKVRFGALDINTNPDGTEVQERSIAQTIIHPDYKPPVKYNDIALMKVDQPVNFNGFVRPACLNVDKITIPTGIATGWGKTQYDAEGGSSKLMKVTITFIDKDKCAGTYKQEIATKQMPDIIPDSLLCAGEMNGGKDTCQGDSGGPLQTVLKEPECMYNLLGVTSFGKFCGFKNSPAIYTNIAHFVGWIESNVWN